MILRFMLTESVAYWCKQLSEKASATYRFTNSDDFKQKCLDLIEEVAGTSSSEELAIYKSGRVVAIFVPENMDRRDSLFGIYKGKLDIPDDQIKPIDVKWENDERNF